jgi:hypothetical protein
MADDDMLCDAKGMICNVYKVVYKHKKEFGNIRLFRRKTI